ncbi:similar to Saccharomyces cerevisiae YIL074C SER33 3-phosphoglycerate dehydrogenase, catalyzes the first step in serine and glycine biosynthesis [Maudiozyma barnettii]|uniref:phosphoglycerate dehydrogenase n=1 Tax=Maudiozyma barnettii TaxID=61262 RepID=A0A8H2VBI3_9SACH|nr:phosphoglycerate dehydrogenase SER33 [Kazachstania barnettii]CAB4252233.1 similar to Saccharomyces cerevisiae YIL074C SER33 3-phosphoglycerate dehydrogenase, catalyzes the first step in serine and glycine biosynthesis [Kazachstania barnettii]CAD1778885.1 similar to Saccharomyces cerevisiae YIL074C SER33 3-phosphoglycerate dehydrogenase, catalyzes the first step in serine and glycine biosynthesis [Kazachstania barnettii]
MSAQVQHIPMMNHVIENYLGEDDMAFSPTESFMNALPRRISILPQENKIKPFSKSDIKILLLENINSQAIVSFRDQAYQVESYRDALPESVLIEKIRDVHAIGIRSKTMLSKEVLKQAKNLMVIGCYCIGTNQVDLEYAANMGVAVFNSPFSNSRSVAELVLADIISLSRRIIDRSLQLRKGEWENSSKHCYEVRGKTVGIIGYGHIGSQLSILAEGMGMHVIYYDILNIMAIGKAKQVATMEELLVKADFVTLHVPETPDTNNLISWPQITTMKEGSYLLNSSRGSIVDTSAIVSGLKSGKLLGAALDVYPNEPRYNGEHLFTNRLNKWTAELVSLPNVILTPHIGGATIEAQSVTGLEVSEAIANFITQGISIDAVNFPEVSLRQTNFSDDVLRILFAHLDVPGVLRTVNNILAAYNIEKQYSESNGKIAYVITDISSVTQNDVHSIYNQLDKIPEKVTVRLIY